LEFDGYSEDFPSTLGYFDEGTFLFLFLFLFLFFSFLFFSFLFFRANV
jgi:hypothetical protein